MQPSALLGQNHKTEPYTQYEGRHATVILRTSCPLSAQLSKASYLIVLLWMHKVAVLMWLRKAAGLLWKLWSYGGVVVELIPRMSRVHVGRTPVGPWWCEEGLREWQRVAGTTVVFPLILHAGTSSASLPCGPRRQRMLSRSATLCSSK